MSRPPPSIPIPLATDSRRLDELLVRESDRIKQARHRRIYDSTGVRFLAAAAVLTLVASLVVALFASNGCSADANRRAATVTIVAGGVSVAALQAANHDAYRLATGALLARGVRGEEYEIATRPIDAEFEARGQAIRVLSLALYSTARCLDGDCVSALGPMLEAVDRALVVLATGGVLPAVAISPELTAAVAVLRAGVPR